jgi:hypothetical protein
MTLALSESSSTITVFESDYAVCSGTPVRVLRFPFEHDDRQGHCNQHVICENVSSDSLSLSKSIEFSYDLGTLSVLSFFDENGCKYDVSYLTLTVSGKESRLAIEEHLSPSCVLLTGLAKEKEFVSPIVTMGFPPSLLSLSTCLQKPSTKTQNVSFCPPQCSCSHAFVWDNQLYDGLNVNCAFQRLTAFPPLDLWTIALYVTYSYPSLPHTCPYPSLS